MRAFWILARLRALDVLRSRSAAALFFGLPMGLLILIGVLFANGHPFEQRTVAIVESSVGSERLERVEARLVEESEVRVVRVRDREEGLGQLRSRMVNALLVRAPAGAERDSAQEGWVLSVGRREALFGRGAVASLVEAGEPATLNVIPLPRWGYVHYLFPAVLTITVLIAGLFGMGYAMVRYRQSLFLKKLATTPLSKASFVAAQVAARSALTLGQMALLLVAGSLAFGLPVTLGALPWLLLITTLGLLTFMGLGFVLAAAIKSTELMVDVISMLNLFFVLASEMFFSVEALPAPLPQIAGALPSTLLIRLLRAVMLEGITEPGPLLPGLLGLLAWTLLTFLIAVRAFRWHR